ncbi:hypothetical protein HDU67_002035 [Dinochytrium kinnereticum]|nr:hypothetical protein HDU67_002035 [Dinochytrium kinnereticum]
MKRKGGQGDGPIYGSSLCFINPEEGDGVGYPGVFYKQHEEDDGHHRTMHHPSTSDSPPPLSQPQDLIEPSTTPLQDPTSSTPPPQSPTSPTPDWSNDILASAIPSRDMEEMTPSPLFPSWGSPMPILRGRRRKEALARRAERAVVAVSRAAERAVVGVPLRDGLRREGGEVGGGLGGWR